MNNPPAFPLHNHGAQTLGLQVTGMTLRDYFAAKAMVAFIDKDEWQSTIGQVSKEVALKSYAMADAMLREKEK
jgi:hypothetical protein